MNSLLLPTPGVGSRSSSGSCRWFSQWPVFGSPGLVTGWLGLAEGAVVDGTGEGVEVLAVGVGVGVGLGLGESEGVGVGLGLGESERE